MCLANDTNENDKQSSKSSSNLTTRSLEHMVATIMNEREATGLEIDKQICTRSIRTSALPLRVHAK